MAPPLSKLNNLSTTMSGISDLERLEKLCAVFAGRKVFTTSFGQEDQYIAHLIFSAGLNIDVVTLDTGRLFSETYDVWAATEAQYGVKIQGYCPDAPSIEDFTFQNGINGFYESLENRKSCCFIRKVEPLKRAIKGAELWITGIRSEQSAGRQSMSFLVRDDENDLVKANPILDLKKATLEDFLAKHSDIPVNALHNKGYPSIGCQPCTRAIEPGEDDRAGRWWWENDDQQECGLHVGPDGRLVRTKKTPS